MNTSVNGSKPWRIKLPTPVLFQDRWVFKRVRASEKTEESAPTYEPDTQVCAKKAFTSRWR